MDERIDIRSLTLSELEDSLAGLGEPKYRAKQVYKWLHAKNAREFDEMSDLSKALRLKCDKNYYINTIIIKKRLVSALDGTVKYLYGLSDGNAVEAVLMKYGHGNSLCISTQAGCRMGCSFCASAGTGLARGLSASEMLSEVYEANSGNAESGGVSSVVLMGIGEPLDNYDNVIRFLRLLSSPDGLGMSLRHVSLSTCGLVDKIDILAHEKLPLTLSVSLHAPNDAIRRKIMPVAKKWPMDELLASCRRYFKETGRRISFEYALMDGVNDHKEHAAELGGKLRGMNCHVNLIPVNPINGGKYSKSGRETVERFAETLSRMGVTTTVRRRLGADINAACGQLRRETTGDNPL